MSSLIVVVLTQRGASHNPGRNTAVSLKGFLFSRDKMERVMTDRTDKGSNSRRNGRQKLEFLKLY